jgi:hypothetical protein
VAQRPITDIAFSEAATEPAWKTIPSWFVYGDHDTAIPPKLHAWMAGRAHARETVTDYPAWARGVGAVGASNMMMVGDLEATGADSSYQIQSLDPVPCRCLGAHRGLSIRLFRLVFGGGEKPPD